MKNIEFKEYRNKVRIVFNHPFDWNFVYSCRDEYISWDDVRKERYLEFKFGTLPLKATRLVEDYPKTFKHFDKFLVRNFEKNFQAYIDSKNKEVPAFFSKKVDFSKYEEILKKSNKELFEHQKTGINFLVNKGSAILADQMGLGKTIQTCIALLELDVKKVLIVTPLSARYVWKDELLNLDVQEKDINIIEKDLTIKKFTIVNYDKVKKFFDKFEKAKFDALILDEAHFIKNRGSQRTKLITNLSKKIKHVIPITGTPLLNKPEELYPLLRIVKHPLGVNFTDFAKRYCGRKLISFGTRSHWETKGATNLDELSEKLKTIMIRRLKEDCLDLPEKIYTTYKIDFSKEQKDRYDNIFDEYIEFCKQTQGISLNRGLIDQHLLKINLLRQVCSEYKKEHTERHILDAIDGDEKILVFGFYNKTLIELHEKYKDISFLITGKTKKEDREGIVKEFQSNKKYKIIFGNINAAGVALTLTAANNVVFNDLYWTPGIHEQSEDRANRIGAIKNTNIYYPLFKDSIEEKIYKLLEDKKIIINKVLKGTVRYYQDEDIVKLLITQMYKQV